MDVTVNFDSNTVVKHTDAIGDIKITMLKGEKGDTGPGDTWGYIEGDIEDQTDLMMLINTKADAADTYNKVQVNEIVMDVESSRAPINHASTSTTYGRGTESNYGHVKLSDSYIVAGTAANGLAPSQAALFNGLENIKTIIGGLFYRGQSSGVKTINLANGATAYYTVTANCKKSTDWAVSVEPRIYTDSLMKTQISVVFEESITSTQCRFYIAVTNHSGSTINETVSSGAVALEILWANGDYVSWYE